MKHKCYICQTEMTTVPFTLEVAGDTSRNTINLKLCSAMCVHKASRLSQKEQRKQIKYLTED